MADPNDHRNPAALCWLCAWRATGWIVQGVRRGTKLPTYLACGRECADQLHDLVMAGSGRIDQVTVTQMEKTAIAAARIHLWNALVPLGLHKPFGKLSEDQIDGVISAVLTGFRESMMQQSMTGDVPFG